MSNLNIPDIYNPNIAPSEWKLAVECRDEEGFRFEQEIECDDRTICTVYDRDCVEVIRLAPAMAREIKRLMEENATLRGELGSALNAVSIQKNRADNLEADYSKFRDEVDKLQDVTKEFQDVAMKQIKAHHEQVREMLDLVRQVTNGKAIAAASLAKPQTDAFESHKTAPLEPLPPGCEPFDAKRAEKEDVRDKEGVIFKYFGRTDKGVLLFKQEGRNEDVEVDSNGKMLDEVPWDCYLYCIAKRLPFDLAKALAGDKVVTRDGRKVYGFKKRNIPDGRLADRDIYPYAADIENGCYMTFTKEGKRWAGKAGAVENEYDLFMEGGV